MVLNLELVDGVPLGQSGWHRPFLGPSDHPPFWAEKRQDRQTGWVGHQPGTARALSASLGSLLCLGSLVQCSTDTDGYGASQRFARDLREI